MILQRRLFIPRPDKNVMGTPFSPTTTAVAADAVHEIPCLVYH